MNPTGSILAVLFLFTAASVQGQTILLKNGTQAPAEGLVRRNQVLMISIKTPDGGRGEVGYPVSDVDEISVPISPLLIAAGALMTDGKYEEALGQIEPAFTWDRSLADIPGNRWAQSGLMKLTLLLLLKRQAEAEALLKDIAGTSRDADFTASAKAQLALFAKFENPDQARVVADQAIAHCSNPATLSQAWLLKGGLSLEEKKDADALLAFLTIVTFYPESASMPAALWGCGQACQRLKDPDQATAAWRKLIELFPRSPQAALAQIELQKKEKKS